MFVRLREDASGAYRLDPKFAISPAPVTLKLSALASEPPDTASVTAAFHPDSEQAEVCDAMTQPIVAAFSKRNNVAVVATGGTATGKSLTINDLIPQVLKELKPTLVQAEQVAEENAAEQGSDPVPIVETTKAKVAVKDETVALEATEEADTTEAETSKAASRTTRRSPKTTMGFGRSTLSPKIIVAQSSPKSTRPNLSALFPNFPLGNLLFQSPPTAPQAADAANPQAEQEEAASAEAAPEEKEEERKAPQRPGLTALPKNGRRGNHEIPCFGASGTPSYAKFPAVPNFNKIISRCTIEFWIKTTVKIPCTVFQITDAAEGAPSVTVELHKKPTREQEDGAILFYITDATHKDLSVKINKDIFDDKWHHIMWEIADLTQARQYFYIDGSKVSNLVLGATENPTSFPVAWKQWFAVGCGYKPTADGMELDDQFTGSIADLKIWDNANAKQVAYWPLDEKDGIEIKDHGPLELHGELVNVPWQQVRMPETAMRFNGKDSYINLGCLGDFGSKVGNCCLDLWFKTSNSTDKMSLFHVTDTMKKQACFCVEMNTDENFNFEKGTTLFYLRDAAGKELSATCQAELYNDQWHSLVFKVSNAASNQLAVTVDGIRVDLQYGRQDGPTAFSNWSQWACIGAGNRRGRSICNYFSGWVKEVRLWHSGNICTAHWPLNEGIGAKVAMDASGNGNNGICRTEGLWGATWLTVELPFLLEPKDDDKLLLEGAGAGEEERRFDNNVIRLSYIQLHSGPNRKELYEERLYDAIHDVEVQALQPIVFQGARAAKEEFLPLSIIPEECWITVTSETLVEEFEAIHENALKNKAKRSHRIVTVQLGDSYLTFFDLLGMFRHKGSTFDRRMFYWTTPKSSIGADDKAKAALNKSLVSFEHCLLQVSSHPQMMKRAMVRHDAIPFHDSMLTQLMQTSLCFGDEPSKLILLHTGGCDPTPAEAQYQIESLTRMEQTAMQYAAVVIQKNFRGYFTRRRCRILATLREKERARGRKVADMQRRFPDQTKPKAIYKALVISSYRYEDERILDVANAEYDHGEIDIMLTRLGYQTVCMEVKTADESLKPTKANILKKIEEMTEEDCQLLVYFVGHGTEGIYFNGPSDEDIQREYDDFIAAEKRRKEEAEEAKRKAQQAEEERKKRDAEEAERKRLEEEEEAKAKAKKGKGGKDDKKGKGGKDKKGKKGKKEEVETEVVEESQEDQAQEVVEEKVVEEVVEQAPKPEMDPVKFIMPYDAKLEFHEDEVITIDELKKLVLGQPKLGVHRVLIVDAAPLGDPYWWKPKSQASEEPKVPAEAKEDDFENQGVDEPVVEASKGFFMLSFSSGDELTFQSNSTHAPIGLYYIKKGLYGCAAPRRRGDVSEEENNRITPDSMLNYISFKLRHLKPKVGVVDRTEEGAMEYVGDLLLSKKLLTNKNARKEEKRQAKKKRNMVLCTFAFKQSSNIYDPDLHLNLYNRVKELVKAVKKGEEDTLEFRQFAIKPYLRLYYKGCLLDTKRPLWLEKFNVDFPLLYPGLDHVKYTFENADSGMFAINVTTSDELDTENKFNEIYHTVLPNFWGMRVAGMQPVKMRVFGELRVLVSPTQGILMDKIYRTTYFHPDYEMVYFLRLNEDKTKSLDDADRAAKEGRERQEAAKAGDKMAMMEERKAEEDKRKSEESQVSGMVSKLQAIEESQDPQALEKAFSMGYHPEIHAAACQACVSLIQKSTASLNGVIKEVVLKTAIKYVSVHVSSPEVTLAGCSYLATVANVIESVPMMDNSRDALIRYGVIPVLCEVAKAHIENGEVLAVACDALGGLCESRAKVLIGKSGIIPTLTQALSTHEDDSAPLGSLLWCLSGLASFASFEERQKILEAATNGLNRHKSSPKAQMHSIQALVALSNVMESARSVMRQDETMTAVLAACKRVDTPDLMGSVVCFFVTVQETSSVADFMAKNNMPGLITNALGSAKNNVDAKGTEVMYKTLMLLHRCLDAPYMEEEKGLVTDSLKSALGLYSKVEAIQAKGLLLMKSLKPE